MNEVLCDVSPLDVADVLLGQPYFWRRHDVYESRPRAVIITLGNNICRILEVGRNYITDMLYIQYSPNHTLFDFMHDIESLLQLIINCGNKINCMHTLQP